MARALNRPLPARVRWGGESPVEVNGEAIEALRESWLVEDRWWTEEPLRRRYWELVGERGRNIVVFHDLGAAGEGPGEQTEGTRAAAGGGWFIQSP
jgi:hypothetical protein